MKLIEVIKQSAIMLDLNEILELTEYGGTVNTASDYAIAQINNLKNCVNIVVDELACDYFPLKKEQKVVPDATGEVSYAALDAPILQVLSIKNGSGYNIPYKEYPTYLQLEQTCAVNIVYSRLPQVPTTINSQLDIVNAQLTTRIVALGVACEYCLNAGRIDQAEFFDRRFKDALLMSKTKRSEIRLPRRRWF